MKVWLNGEIVDAHEARVPLLDRGLLYGDGLFETFRTYGGRPFALEAHLERLLSSAAFFNLRVPVNAAALRRAIDELLRTNELTDAGVRLTVTRGPSSGPLGLPEPASPNVFIHPRRLPIYPEELYRQGMKLVTSSVTRNGGSPASRHKTLNYMDSLLARQQAQERGADEALMLDESGQVAECATANVFAAVDGAVLTPSLKSPILAGVTRAIVLDCCRERAIPVRQESFDPVKLRQAEEVFLTNSLMELMPVTLFDGVPVGSGRPGPVVESLSRMYRSRVRRECEQPGRPE